MTNWGGLAGETASALIGTLAGGAIAVFVARWQTVKSIEAQVALAASQEAASTALARSQWAQQRSAEAAQRLLERLAALYARLPSLPDVALEEPRLSVQAREHCAEALELVRHGMQTDLLSIEDEQVRARFRTLVKLSFDVAWRGIGQGNPERQIRDVRGYLRYVQLTLEAVIDGSPVPGHCEPPVLDRSDGEAWAPPNVPWHWRDPADGS